MFSALSAFVRSRKLLPRLVFGTIGALAAITVVKVWDAQANEVKNGAVERMLSEVPSELFEVVRTDYPVEYAAFVEDLKRVIKRSGDVKQATYEHLLAIRVGYAPHLEQADNQLLAVASERMANLYSMVLEELGPQTCADFATIGMPALTGTDFEANHGELLLNNVAAIMHAARAGFDHPVNRPAASDADWQAVTQESLGNGADIESFLAMADGQSVLGTCPSLIGLLTAADTLEKTGGSRVRAELMAMFAGQV